MPTFDFQCARCGETFEKRLAVGVRTKPPCPHCGSRKTEKLIVPPAVHFRGSGFYKTDTGTKAAQADNPSKAPQTKTPKPSKATE